MSENGTPKPHQLRSLITIDVGSSNTRAALFDTVEGRYRFISTGMAPSTASAPMFDIGEGMRLAVGRLEEIVGRKLMGVNEHLIIPSLDTGEGADNLAATLSAGAPIKTVVAGLLDQVSLHSAMNLAHSTYTNVVETISIGSKDSNESRIDQILRIRPDLIIIAGGTDNGASYSVLKLVNTLGMALFLMPEESRPEVLFAGNIDLTKQVDTFLNQIAKIHTAPNIRPTLSVERLGPAQSVMTDIFRRVNSLNIIGVTELNTQAGGNLIPSSTGLGRVIRFFSNIVRNPSRKGVLGIDVGSSATTIAAGFNGDLRLRVFNDLGMGTGLIGVLQNIQLEDITRWMPLPIKDGYVFNYIQNKIVYPNSVPATQEDMIIEQSLAREIIRFALKQAESTFPKNAPRLSIDTLPIFAPILVGGGVLSLAPTPAESLLIVLDAVQPNGIQQIILDKNNIAPGLGAAAAINPTLVAQLLLDPVAFLNLGTVIAPVSKARQGTPILRVRIAYATGHENTITIKQGNLTKIPLPIGQRATLYLDPLQRANIGAGPGKNMTEQVVGGPFGVVVDARGRPLILASDPERRRKQLQKWHISLRR